MTVSELIEALKPFATLADWADQNGYDLHQLDILLRDTRDGSILGHVGALNPADCAKARDAIDGAMAT